MIYISELLIKMAMLPFSATIPLMWQWDCNLMSLTNGTVFLCHVYALSTYQLWIRCTLLANNDICLAYHILGKICSLLSSNFEGNYSFCVYRETLYWFVYNGKRYHHLSRKRYYVDIYIFFYWFYFLFFALYVYVLIGYNVILISCFSLRQI